MAAPRLAARQLASEASVGSVTELVAALANITVDRIVLAAGTYEWLDTDSACSDMSWLCVDRAVTIEAAAAGTAVLDANGWPHPVGRRVLEITGTGVRLIGLRITGGSVFGVPNYYLGTGGGILIAGSATLSRCEIYGNSATGPGGGILVSHNGEATLSDCEIHSNYAGGVPGGGGIAIGGAANLTRCNIYNNSAYWSGGGVLLGPWGVFNGGSQEEAAENGGSAILSHCDLYQNEAGYGGGYAALGSGGEYALVEFTDIYENSAVIDGWFGWGAGVFIASGRSATLDHCNIRENRNAGIGGGLEIDGEATLTYVTIHGNDADDACDPEGYPKDACDASMFDEGGIKKDDGDGISVYTGGVLTMTCCTVVDTILNNGTVTQTSVSTALCPSGEFSDGCTASDAGACAPCTTATAGQYYTGQGGYQDECPVAAAPSAPLPPSEPPLALPSSPPLPPLAPPLASPPAPPLAPPPAPPRPSAPMQSPLPAPSPPPPSPSPPSPSPLPPPSPAPPPLPPLSPLPPPPPRFPPPGTTSIATPWTIIGGAVASMLALAVAAAAVRHVSRQRRWRWQRWRKAADHRGHRDSGAALVAERQFEADSKREQEGATAATVSDAASGSGGFGRPLPPSVAADLSGTGSGAPGSSSAHAQVGSEPGAGDVLTEPPEAAVASTLGFMLERLDQEREDKRRLQERNEQLQAEKERLMYDLQLRTGRPLDDDDNHSAILRGLKATRAHEPHTGETHQPTASQSECPSDAGPADAESDSTIAPSVHQVPPPPSESPSASGPTERSAPPGAALDGIQLQGRLDTLGQMYRQLGVARGPAEGAGPSSSSEGAPGPSHEPPSDSAGPSSAGRPEQPGPSSEEGPSSGGLAELPAPAVPAPPSTAPSASLVGGSEADTADLEAAMEQLGGVMTGFMRAMQRQDFLDRQQAESLELQLRAGYAKSVASTVTQESAD